MKIKYLNNKKEYIYIIPFIFYIFFWLIDGAVWCADTASYVEMHMCREPLYPMYLAMFRRIFGSDAVAPMHSEQLLYLFMAVLGQSLIAAYADVNVCKYISRRFSLNRAMSTIILALPMMTSLLCRFASKRASMYSNSILTESIAISIYLLFVRYCLEYVLDHTKSAFISSLLLGFIAISLRKQMYVLIVLLVLAVVYVTITADSVKRYNVLAKGMIAIVGIILASRLLDYTYNYVMFGYFRGHTEDNRFLSTMAFYVSEREDVEYVDPRLRYIFLEIYDKCDAEEWLMHSAPNGFLDAEEHFANSYDHIQIDTMDAIISYNVDNDVRDYSWLGEGDKKDLIRNSLNEALLSHRLGRISKVFLHNFVAGLITTVAVKRPILNIYAFLIFAIYIAMISCICSILAKERNREQKYDDSIDSLSQQCKATLMMGILVLLSVVGNVSLVAAVIFTQTRYTIYNMPLFYMAFVCMLWQLLVLRKKRRERE